MRYSLTFPVFLATALGLVFSVPSLAQVPPATPGAPPAQPPAPPARGPALDLSLEAAKAAIEACKAREQNVAVSVVDSAGVLKVLLAGEGAHARGVASSTTKAVTALTFKRPTSALGEQVKTDKELSDKITGNERFNVRAGGIPLTVGGEIIGALG